MNVSDIMTSPVVTAHEDETLREVAIKMLHNKIGGLPVINDEGKMTGFLSETDFVAKRHKIPFSRVDAPKLFGMWLNKDDVEDMYEQAKVIKIKEVMSKNVVYVSPEDSIEDLVNEIMESNFHRLPVVEDDKPIGIISRRDLLKLLIKK